MNFLLTNYIYPLKEKVLLSKELDIYFDNPRTDKEIHAVTQYIIQAYSIESAFQFSEEIIQHEVKEFLDEYSKKEDYIREFYAVSGNLNQYEILARMWIVARYNDEGLHIALNEEGKKMREEGQHGFFLLEDDSPIIRNSRQLVDYSHLVSLLTHTTNEYYVGRSFILEESEDWFQEIKPNHLLCVQFLMFSMFTGHDSLAQTDENRWLYFPAAQQELIEIGRLLDNALGRESKDKLLYIASLLKNAGSDIKEDKTQLVVLVSILELLLTHNPDFNRFNVEDSINKQFQLKGATLIYLHDRSKDIYQLKARMKEIYGLRSGIAHGDFKSVTNYIEAAKKKGENYPFSALISELYGYLRAIIMVYLQDEKLVEFLKES